MSNAATTLKTKRQAVLATLTELAEEVGLEEALATMKGTDAWEEVARLQGLR